MMLKRYIGILSVFFFVYSVCFGQVAQWEKSFRKYSGDPGQQLEYNDSIMGYYRRQNVDSALFYAFRHRDIATKNDIASSVNYAHSVIASLYRYKGLLDSSLTYHHIALEGYRKEDYLEAVAASHSNIANVYKQQSRYDLAIRNYFQAIDIMKDAEDKSVLLNMYANLAGLYFRLENYEKAFHYWDISDQVAVESGADYYTYGYRGKARISIKHKKYDKAEKLMQKALQTDLKNENRIYLYEDYLILLKLYSETANTPRFRQTDALIQPFLKIENPVNLNKYHEFSGNYYFNKADYAKAVAHYDQCLQLVKGQNEEDFVENAQRISGKKFYALVLGGDPNTYKGLYDDIARLTVRADELKKVRLSQELDAEYELNETKEANARLDERSRFYEELSLKNKQRNTLLVIILGILILFVAYMIYNGQRLRKITRQLEENVRQKDFLLKELNHRVKNNLFIVSSFFGIEKQGRSGEIIDILNIMESRVHSLGLMYELLYKNDVSEDISVKDYFEKLIEFINRTILNEDFRIRMEIEDGIKVNVNKLSYIGLIVNELLTNAFKYAKIEGQLLNIELSIRQEQDMLCVKISDDGVGLPDDFDIHRRESMGLKMADGLSQQLNGMFVVERPETGSLFTVRIPNPYVQ